MYTQRFYGFLIVSSTVLGSARAQLFFSYCTPLLTMCIWLQLALWKGDSIPHINVIFKILACMGALAVCWGLGEGHTGSERECVVELLTPFYCLFIGSQAHSLCL